jgi:Short C-terminal domain
MNGGPMQYPLDYVRDAAGTSQADELAKLADLTDRGIITDAEFEQGKAKILA